MNRDAADYTEASYTHDFAAHCDSPEDELRELSMLHRDPVVLLHEAHRIGTLAKLGFASDHHPHELLRRLLMLIGDDRGAGLRVWCLDYLCGAGIFPAKTEAQIGVRWGCTRSNVSRIVKVLQRKLGLPAPPGGKRDAAGAVYAARARRNHVEGRISRTRTTHTFYLRSASLYDFTTCQTPN